MGLTRRRFLACAAALAATAGTPSGLRAGPSPGTKKASGHAAGTSESLALARDDLRRLVTGRALVVDDPWVLMHVLLALGADARHGDEPVLDTVVREWVEPVTAAGKTYQAFPLKVEAHPNHFLGVMYETGVSPDRRFATGSGAVTRAELYASAKALFSPAFPGGELSWTVGVFTASMPPDDDRFENAQRQSFTVSALVEVLAQATEAAYRDTVAAMRGAKPYGRSALQALPCNGTHVLGGLLDALRNGYRAQGLRERTTELMRAALFRLGAETALIDQVIGQSRGPQAQLNADAAKLQFLGHSLESLGFARRHALYTPTAAELAQVRTAEGELAAVVRRLVATHDLDALQRQVPRAYWVVLGDACHALHALESSPA